MINFEVCGDKAGPAGDNKLRYVEKTTIEGGLPVTRSIHVKYDPMGNRVWKQTSDGVNSQAVKFIIDVNSQLPVILCELEADSSSPDFGSLKKSYYYADAQVLCQRHHDPVDPNLYDPSYYVHDRLGSVRLVVRAIEEPGGWVVRAANSYTYTPFGSLYEEQCIETIANPWKFTGQWHDVEIDQYHLRARQYDPTMMRFTSRDPVRGEYFEPLTLHKYLYCSNDPFNKTDIDGKSALQIANGLRAMTSVYAAGLGIATYGAKVGNFDLISLGAAIQQVSPLAFAIGFSSTSNITQVTRWGGGFRLNSYGIQGGGSFFNYMKTMKWLPYPGHPGALPWNSTTAYYLTDSLYMPTGALSFIDILFGFVKVPF